MSRKDDAARSATRWPLLGTISAIVLAGIVAYHDSFDGVRLLDDLPTIEHNPSIQTLESANVWAPPATVGTAGRPFANLTFAINYALGGTHVGGYHAFNLLVHLATALLVAAIVRRTLLLPRCREQYGQHATMLSRLVGLTWVVHPLTTGTVTYLSQRTEALAACAAAATLGCGLMLAATHRTRWAFLGVVACALGMASKETAVTVPLVVLLYDLAWVAGSLRAAWQQRGRWYLALAACWALLGILLAGAHLGGRGVGLDHGITPWAYASIECRALLIYLKLSFWAHPLVFDYGWPRPVSALVATTGVVTALLGAAACVAGAGRGKLAGWLGLLWLLLLAPTSSIVPIADQPIAENRAYLPLAIALTAAIVGGYRLIGSRLFLPAGLAVVALTLATLHRNEVYRTAGGPWRDVLRTQPASPRALNALGVLALESGDLPQAIRLHTQAASLRPGYAEAHGNLGGDLYRAGRLDEAVEQFRRALALQPNLAGIRASLANALLALGNARLRAGEVRGAIIAYEAALRDDPDFAAAQNNLASALLQTGDRDGALQHATAAVQLNPDYAAAHGVAAMALLQLGRLDSAIEQFRAALDLDPRVAATHNGLGLALARKGLPEQAAEQFRAALRLNPRYAPAAKNLAQLEQERSPAATPRP